jgi:molybdopterin molybdotransferase
MQPGGPQGFGVATLPVAPATAAEAPPAATPASASAATPATAGVNTAPDAAPTPPASITLPVLCLPGNPVSALVSFEMFVRPALRRLSHSEPSERVREVAMMADPADSPPGTYQVRRGFVAEDGTVALIGGPSSHLLHSYASSNALVHIPADVERLDVGDPVMVWRIDD